MAEKAFIPPTFANIGKKIKDLLGKRYDFNHTVLSKNKTKAGVVIESGGATYACNDRVAADKRGQVYGLVKGKYEDKSFGELETEVNTSGKAAATVKLSKLATGLTVKGGAYVDPDKDKPFKDVLVANANVEYAQDFFATTLNVDGVNQSAFVEATGVIGFDGLSVGGQIKIKADGNGKDVDDYNVGFEYARADLTLALKTEERGDKIVSSFVHKVTSDYLFGGRFTLAPENAKKGKPTKILELGADYNLDATTNIKAKVDVFGRTLGTSIQHQLASPQLQLSLASSFDIKGQQLLQAKEFGLGLTFGDY